MRHIWKTSRSAKKSHAITVNDVLGVHINRIVDHDAGDDAGNDENEPYCNLIPEFSGCFSFNKTKIEWKSLVIVKPVDLEFVLNERLQWKWNTYTADTLTLHSFTNFFLYITNKNKEACELWSVDDVHGSNVKVCNVCSATQKKKQSIKTEGTDRCYAGWKEVWESEIKDETNGWLKK